MSEVARRYESGVAVLGTILSLGYMPTFIDNQPVSVVYEQSTEGPTRWHQLIKDIGRLISTATTRVEPGPDRGRIDIMWKRTTYHYMAEARCEYRGAKDAQVIAFGKENDRLLSQLSPEERRLASDLADECLSDPIAPILLARELTTTPRGHYILGDYSSIDLN